MEIKNTKLNKQTISYLDLNNGTKMPILGLGTQPYEITSRVSKENMTELLNSALSVGYRSIDTARNYRNEIEIGESLSIIFSEDGSVEVNHKPIHELWKELELCVELGLVKSIGVANFNCQMIIDLLSYAKIKPVVNQIEITPYLPQTDFISFLRRCNIQVIAISPLGRAGCFENSTGGQKVLLLEDETLRDVAKRNNKSAAQIILRWLVQRGIAIIPKTSKLDRLKENSELFDFELSPEDMQTIFSLESGVRVMNPKHQAWFGYVPIFE